MYRTLITLLLSHAVLSKGCNETECLNIASCNTLQTLLANPPPSLTEALIGSICDLENEVKVCCTNTFDVPVLEHKINRLDECGYQDSIYEFPWMASFVGFGFSLCSGALINERYVLTAGSCASSKFLGTPPLVKNCIHKQFPRPYFAEA
ncbi:hypothetical protein FQR65_LT00635 [Abscondita terminalis]|nr:hypothetical protein FQR65_LT00635 [Abscondita terminalis]